MFSSSSLWPLPLTSPLPRLAILLSSTESPEERLFRRTKLTCGLVLYPTLASLGIILNAGCLIVFRHSYMPACSTNRYLVAVALGDLLKVLNDLVYFPSVLLPHLQLVGGAGAALYSHYYPVGYFLSQYSVLVTTWATLAVSADRHDLVLRPRPHMSPLGRARTATIVSVFIFVLALLVSAPCLLRYERVCVSPGPAPASDAALFICYRYDLNTSALWSRWPYLTQTYLVAQSSLRSVVPLVVLCVLNLRIVQALGRRPRTSRPRRTTEARGRITRMLLVVVALFLLLSLPDSVMTLMKWGYHDAEGSTRKTIREISDTLLLLNADINFFVYLCFNLRFRAVFIHLARCRPYSSPTDV